MQQHDLKNKAADNRRIRITASRKRQEAKAATHSTRKTETESSASRRKTQQNLQAQKELQEDLHEKNVTNQVSREKITQGELRIEKLRENISERNALFKNLDEQTARVEKRIKDLKMDLHEQSQLTLLLSGQRQEIEENQQKNDQTLKDLAKQIQEDQGLLQQSMTDFEKLKMHLRDEREVQQQAVLELLTALKEEKDRYLEYATAQDQLKSKIQAELQTLQNLLEESAEAPHILKQYLQVKSA